jgi:hypothetical protein
MTNERTIEGKKKKEEEEGEKKRTRARKFSLMQSK